MDLDGDNIGDKYDAVTGQNFIESNHFSAIFHDIDQDTLFDGGLKQYLSIIKKTYSFTYEGLMSLDKAFQTLGHHAVNELYFDAHYNNLNYMDTKFTNCAAIIVDGSDHNLKNKVRNVEQIIQNYNNSKKKDVLRQYIRRFTQFTEKSIFKDQFYFQFH